MVADLVGAAAQSQPGVIIRVTQFLIVFSVFGLLIRAVVIGRNWARILYAVIACIAMGATSLVLASKEQGIGRHLVLPAVLIIAYSIILGLLFHRDAASWFRRGKAST
jgi:hypothetical protein